MLASMLFIALAGSRFTQALFKEGANAFSSDKRSKEPAVKASEGGASQPKRKPLASRLPPDVVRDYSYNAVHLLNGAGAPLYPVDEQYSKFMSRLREFPPEVLIVGKEAPFTHSLGPILSFGGENRTFPLPPKRRGEDGRRLLSPEELRLRIKAIERFTSDAHAAGVKTVIPYISPMTAFGNAEKRQGFFQFFDNWDRYEKEFALGQRPAGDPVDWTQRDKDGKTYFRMGGGAEDAQGMTRYSMCINNPGWRRWQMLVAGWIARAGFDGVWMDNVLVHRCYDQYCQAVAKNMGVDLFREPDRVWLESYLRYFDELRGAGGSRRNEFFLGGNYIELPLQREVTDKLDLCMVEQVWLGAARMLWPGGVWTGFYRSVPNARALSNRGQSTGEGVAVNNIWIAQLSYAMRGERGLHFLSGAPAGKSTEFAHNEDSATLALAEAATFGGGTAVQVGNQYPLLSDNDSGANKGRQRFFTFARAHRELYEGLLPAGDIAILVYPDGEAAALIEAQQVQDALLWRGLLVDVLDGDRQSPETLARYSLIIVPGKPQLPQWMKGLPLLQSPDPLSPAEVTAMKRAYQKERGVAQLRQTGLSALALERAGALRALELPQGSLVEACAWSNDRRMVLHLLNFRVPIGLNEGGKVEATGSFAVRLKLPKGKSVREVRAVSADAGTAEPTQFRQKGDVLEFKVSSVRVYKAYEVIFS